MEPKTDTKITLYDADGKKIGDTFSRRARQLVKQQRALWLDESHTAVRFLPDAPEEWEPHDPREAEETPHRTEADTRPDERLLSLAEARIKTRRRFYLHAIALVPGYFFWVLVVETLFWTQGHFTYGLSVGIALTLWTVSFVYTTHRFVKCNRGFFPFARSKNRHAMRLAAEVEMLKRMGYGK